VSGSLDTAYRQLLERGCPSWLYPVDQEATTIWERWDSQLEDGIVNPGWMTSFNHYALGAVAHLMHTTLAGLAPAEPGWAAHPLRAPPGRRAD
jgi:alpha-L-rhamnosidase